MRETVRITVKLSGDEAKDLLKLAEDECRHPRDQARVLIREGLRETKSAERNRGDKSD